MKETFLSRFTPSMMAPEALEALFVQREGLAQRIVDLVRDSALTSSKHHTLLVGPRGIGKTHLIALIYHRLQAMEDLRDHLLVAWLREEEWGVTSFMDLLLRIFRALLAEYDDPDLAKRVEALYELPLKAGEHTGGALLKEFVNNRTLLVLVENLDDLFEGLGDEGQKRLRAYLQDNPFCTLLATAQSLFNGIGLQTSPFYGFFRIHHLEELDFDGAARLLANIATYMSDNELASFIQTPTGRARIRAVHHLAGGNHRVYVIFSLFLTRKSLNELVEPFIRTLDDLTPYYQARMVWLSLQQRKIVEFLCDRQGAVTVKEIAQRCFMTHQTASSQLKDLKDKGYARSQSLGRESYYELREPLMRLCIAVKKNRGEPIRLLVDFLRLWYSRTELEHRLEMVQPDAGIERDYLLHALQAAQEEKGDPRVAACMKDYKTYINSGDFVHALEVADELLAILDDAWVWFLRGTALGGLGRYEEALTSLDKSIEFGGNDEWLWCARAMSLTSLGRYDEALVSCDKAIEFDAKVSVIWLTRAKALFNLERYEEALVSFEKVIEIDPKDISAWLGRGRILGHLGRYQDALVCFEKTIELDPNSPSGWTGKGMVLDNLRRQEEALASYEEASKLTVDGDPVVWGPRASLLGQLGRYEDALASAEKLIGHDSKNSLAWSTHGLALYSLGRYEEALASYNRAIELGGVRPVVFFSLSDALFALNRWDEAIVALDEALQRSSPTNVMVGTAISDFLLNLFKSTFDEATWKRRIEALIELCRKHQVLSALWLGVARSIYELKSPIVSDGMARLWLKIWREIAVDHTELQRPVRLLDAAVQYRETHDPRILLELPVEERTLLEPLLDTKEPAAHEPEDSYNVLKQQVKVRSRSRKKPRT